MKFINLKLSAQRNPGIGLKNPGLSSHLKRISTGSAPTPQSWLYEDVSPEESFKPVLAILEALSKENPVFGEISEDDLHYRDKFGPQGGIERWEVNRKPLLEMSFAEAKPSPVLAESLWQQAKTIAVQRLKLRRQLRPRAPEKVVESVKKKGGLATNSGLPEFTRRAHVVQKSIALSQSDKVWTIPAVIGARSMRQSERNIYMYPFSTNIRGSQYQQVIQDHIRKLKLPEFAAWEGMEAVETAIQPFMSEKYYKLSSDYSKMDNWFRLHHTEEVFDVIKEGFQQQYWADLERSMAHTHKIGIVTPDGLTEGEHGVASGSEWTNFLETLFQFIFWIYVDLRRRATNKAPIAGVLFLGDDAAAFSTEPLTDDFVESATGVGFVANQDKQFESRLKVHYLRRWFYTKYKVNGRHVGVYPLVLNYNSQVNPERFHAPEKWNGRMFVLRALMILENCVGHPAFREYGTYVLKGNKKHFAEFARLDSSSVARAVNEARGIAGFVPSYNQEKIDKPLSSYESLKLLKELYR